MSHQVPVLVLIQWILGPRSGQRAVPAPPRLDLCNDGCHDVRCFLAGWRRSQRWAAREALWGCHLQRRVRAHGCRVPMAGADGIVWPLVLRLSGVVYRDHSGITCFSRSGMGFQTLHFRRGFGRSPPFSCQGLGNHPTVQPAQAVAPVVFSFAFRLNLEDITVFCVLDMA